MQENTGLPDHTITFTLPELVAVCTAVNKEIDRCCNSDWINPSDKDYAIHLLAAWNKMKDEPIY